MVGKNKINDINISVRLSRRALYTLILIGVLIVAGLVVWAYGTSNPSTFGHSAGELAPPAGCASGQVLSWSGTDWVCMTSWSTTSSAGIPRVGEWQFELMNIEQPGDYYRINADKKRVWKPSGKSVLTVPVVGACTGGCGGSNFLLKLEANGLEGGCVNIESWNVGTLSIDVTSVIANTSEGQVDVGIYTCGTADVHSIAKRDNVWTGSEGYYWE